MRKQFIVMVNGKTASGKFKRSVLRFFGKPILFPSLESAVSWYMDHGLAGQAQEATAKQVREGTQEGK